MENETVQADTVDFALSGDYIKNLADKSFEIVLPPYKEVSPDLDKPGQMKEKIVLTIELVTKERVKYYPNKTSQKTIVAKRGYNPQNWLGYKGEFETRSQQVGKDMKEVIFIKEKK